MGQLIYRKASLRERFAVFLLKLGSKLMGYDTARSHKAISLLSNDQGPRYRYGKPWEGFYVLTADGRRVPFDEPVKTAELSAICSELSSVLGSDVSSIVNPRARERENADST